MMQHRGYIFLNLAMAVVFAAAAAHADTIILKTGRRIKAAHTWEEEGRVCFVKYGQNVAIPKSQILRVDRPEPAGKKADAPAQTAIRLAETDRHTDWKALDAEYRALVQEKNRFEQLGISLTEQTTLQQKARYLSEKVKFHYLHQKPGK